MGLENVEKAVLAEAQAEAAEIVAKARSSLEKKLAAARNEIEERIEARRKHEMARIESEHNRQLSSARTEARLAVLKAKNALIDRAMNGALDRLVEIPEAEFSRLAGLWLSEIPKELEGSIAAGERERSILSGGLLDKINAGRSGKLVLSDEPGPAGGGMVVRAEKFEFDFSWAGRLADRKGALAPQVAGILFGKKES